MKLTLEEIDRMPAGPEIDVLIAEHVFNAKRISPEMADLISVITFQFSHYHNSALQFSKTLLIRQLPQKNQYTGCDFEFVQPYEYSKRISDAWDVLVEMRLSLIPTLGGDFQCDTRANTKIPYVEAHGPAPLAICRCALKIKLMEAKNDR